MGKIYMDVHIFPQIMEKLYMYVQILLQIMELDKERKQENKNICSHFSSDNGIR